MTLSTADKKWLSDRFGNRIRFDEPMSRHTSLGVGGPAEALVYPYSREDVLSVITGARERKIPYLVVGGGTNLIVADQGVSGIVMILAEGLGQLNEIDTRDKEVRVYAGAGVPTKALCRFCLSRGYGGMNFALGIPGTVGGAIRMNAGTTQGWMSDKLLYIEVVYPMGAPQKVYKNQIISEYRSLAWDTVATACEKYPPVILGGAFGFTPTSQEILRKEARWILKTRASRQPIYRRSAGCFFKNPSAETSAGRLIEEAGLKGRKRGGAIVSIKHANFILNMGQATATDILGLMDTVQETVLSKYGIMLEPEVQIVGKEEGTEK
jgi:UDP-N-acetylmuramate dehydrogenase